LNIYHASNEISSLPLNRFRFVTPRQIRGTGAFTLIELMMVIAIISILAAFAVGGFRFYVKKAYNVTLQHDLKNFAAIQEDYYVDNSRYFGGSGDYIQGGATLTGPLASAEFKFRPSTGVKIEIISGNGASPEGPPAFRARAVHEKASKRYTYDFVTDQMTEEENQ